MDRHEIMERLQSILTDPDRMSISIEECLEDSTSFLSDLALDSIQILELIVGIEKEFGIVVDTDEIDLEIFDRVDSVVSFIGNLAAATPKEA